MSFWSFPFHVNLENLLTSWKYKILVWRLHFARKTENKVLSFLELKVTRVVLNGDFEKGLSSSEVPETIKLKFLSLFFPVALSSSFKKMYKDIRVKTRLAWLHVPEDKLTTLKT